MRNYRSFETERLILRPTSEEDGLLIFQLLNSPKWLRFIGDRNVHSEEEGREYIRTKMLPQLENLGYSNYTVIRKADNMKLGSCGLYDRVGLEGIDIGFAFLPAFERMGYGFESAQEIKRVAIEEFGVTVIKGITDKENIASQKLLEKIGLSFKGLVKLPGEEEELFLYEYMKEEKGEDHPLSLREIKLEDVDLIADYWLKSDPDFLRGMGVDIKKLPQREDLIAVLTSQVETPLREKQSYDLIWELDGQPVGHCNVNGISFGEKAHMHLHLWNSGIRKKGVGSKLVKMSLPVFFDQLELNVIYCEPYALNPAPNKTLEKVGFELEKKYVTIPGSLNFEQEVNRWKLSREKFQKMNNNKIGRS